MTTKTKRLRINIINARSKVEVKYLTASSHRSLTNSKVVVNHLDSPGFLDHWKEETLVLSF